MGTVFIVAVTSVTIPFNSKYKAKYQFKSLAISILAWIILFSGIGFLSYFIFNLSAITIIISSIVNVLICSFMLHQSQMIEHGNVIAESDWNVRNLLTRNLKKDGIFEKIFLLVIHSDATEHVLHHTLVKVYSRPFPGKVPMPGKAVYISFKSYLPILWGMLMQNAQKLSFLAKIFF